MKIFLDDVRNAPDGWVLCRWPDEVIEHLKFGNVDEISLDHDLGNDAKGTGYEVITWIEKNVQNGFVPPLIKVHSANTVAKARMLAGIASINRMME